MIHTILLLFSYERFFTTSSSDNLYSIIYYAYSSIVNNYNFFLNLFKRSRHINIHIIYENSERIYFVSIIEISNLYSYWVNEITIWKYFMGESLTENRIAIGNLRRSVSSPNKIWWQEFKKHIYVYGNFLIKYN